MFVHESCLLVCRPYFNITKLWAFDSKLHLPPVDTTFCLLSSLFAFLLVYMLSCFFTCHVYHAYLLYASITCPLFLCMYTYGARMHGARAQSPRCKQKGRGCKHVDISQAAMFSSFRGLAFPIWLCTLLKPLPSSFSSLLDGLY